MEYLAMRICENVFWCFINISPIFS